MRSRRKRARREGRGTERTRASCVVLLALSLSGCHFGTFPNPNDPNTAGLQQPDVLQRQLKGASEALMARVVGREIDDRQYRDLLAAYATDLLKSTAVERIQPEKAWEYAEVFRTARMWKQSEALYRVAVKVERDETRNVTDRLRLAESQAALGKVDEAVATARETFAASPGAKVPILYGVLLEIVPAARHKGKDPQLARLLEDAIRQSDLAQVDPRTTAGRAFLEALPFHQRNARALAARMYLSADRLEDAERVLGGKPPTLRV